MGETIVIKITVNKYVNRGTMTFKKIYTAVGHELFLNGVSFKKNKGSYLEIKKAGPENEFFIFFKDMTRNYTGEFKHSFAYARMSLWACADEIEGNVQLEQYVDYNIDFMYGSTIFFKGEDVMFGHHAGVGLMVEGKPINTYLEKARGICTASLLFQNGDSAILDDTVIIKDPEHGTTTEVQFRDNAPSVIFNKSFMSDILGLSDHSYMVIPYQDDNELECWNQVGISDGMNVTLSVREYKKSIKIKFKKSVKPTDNN